MFDEMKFSTYYEVIASELRRALGRYYDTWQEILCKDENRRELYLSTIEQTRISVVVLTCSLLEHTINFYLCTKCSALEFRKLEREPFLKKWTTIPKSFASSYSIASNSGVLQELRRILRRRVSIVHAKPMLSIDGDNRHPGNVPDIKLDETSLMESCATLPFRLVENLLLSDRDAFFSMSSIRTTCGSVMQGLSGAKHRFEYAKNLPEELVKEIEAHGHSRERARLFASLIGPVPSRYLDKSIAVHRYGETIAVLPPLRFFDSIGFVLDQTDPAWIVRTRTQASKQASQSNNPSPSSDQL